MHDTKISIREHVGAQIVIGHDDAPESLSHAPHDVRHSPNRHTAVLPFRERLRRHAHQRRELDLSPTQRKAFRESTVCHIADYVIRQLTSVKLQIGGPIAYNNHMVYSAIPTARQPSEFLSLADWLKDTCRDRGHAAALAIAMDVSRYAISKWMAGGIPDPPQLRRMAEVLRVPFAELLLLAHCRSVHMSARDRYLSLLDQLRDDPELAEIALAQLQAIVKAARKRQEVLAQKTR